MPKALCVGLGRMGTFHARILRDLGYDVTTCDPDPSKGADLTGYAAGMWRGAAAVAIAVPIEHAAEEASRWAGFAGHLLLEKPFARTTAEAEALITELIDVKVGVGYVERFNSQARDLKRTLDVQWPVRSATFSRLNMRRPTPFGPPDDVALDLRSHDVDLTHWLGLDIERACYVTSGEAFALSRRVDVEFEVPPTVCGLQRKTWDLTAHDANPLCAQWHSFLMDKGEIATMDDAAAVLAALGR